MITVKDKAKCCGCEACAQICPKQCIKMQFDEEGYRYPKVDNETCINCHLCEKVCPYNCIEETKIDRRQPILTLAAKNKDSQVVLNSSSGGVFYELAKRIISNGGYIFGAVLNEELKVIHTCVDSTAELSRMMGSKYVQSAIDSTYICIEDCLKKGKPCLFSGTPCQVAGLLLFLKKDYENLITVDVVCHGVPSPGVWNKYLSDTIKKFPEISADKDSSYRINFRRKKDYSWSGYGFSIERDGEILISQLSSANPFIRSFITNNCLRPSCYECVYKGHLKSDITLGDFWGIDKIAPDFYDEKGVSLVIINTDKGLKTMPMDKFIIEKVDYNEVLLYNSAIVGSPLKPITRKKFFRLCANPSRDLTDVIKIVAPIEQELSAIDKIKYLPTKICRYIHRKLKRK